jgi:uncharacterized membrane protein YhhN
MITLFNALLALAALAALAYQIAFAARPEGSHSPAASLIKTLSTAALALAGVAAQAPALIIAGLALGSAGDFALSRPGTRAFLAGMAAFALGHLAYVAAFVTRGLELGGPVFGPVQTGLLVLLVLLIASTEVWLAPRTADMRGPVRGYGLIIGAMAAAVILLPAHAGDRILQTGAVLFLLSDTLLAIRLFVARGEPAQRALGYAVWPAYWLGQALILWGSLSYWLFSGG